MIERMTIAKIETTILRGSDELLASLIARMMFRGDCSIDMVLTSSRH